MDCHGGRIGICNVPLQVMAVLATSDTGRIQTHSPEPSPQSVGIVLDPMVLDLTGFGSHDTAVTSWFITFKELYWKYPRYI